MVMHHHPELSVRRQCALLGLARSGMYYRPRAADGTNAVLLRRLDERYTAPPFLGSRKLTALLRSEGHAVNRKRVLRLLRLMGLQAVYPKPNTSRPHPAHLVYPYLLKGLDIVRPTQVWATDITYIRLTKGWAYRVAIMDWYSRRVLSWKLAATMECGFCVEALEAALDLATPDIFNRDQGRQFTAGACTGVLAAAGVRISMDGTGSYHDNIFTERLWRSVKYEEVDLKEYATLDEAEAGIAAYFAFYNSRRPHQALAYQTPSQVHFALAGPPPVDMMDNTSPTGFVLPTYPQAQPQPSVVM